MRQMSSDLGQQILSMNLVPLDLGYKLHQNNGIWFHVRKLWSLKKNKKKTLSHYNQPLKDSAREMHSNELVV